MIGVLREFALAVGIKEDVLAVLEERHIDVHAGTGRAIDGLGHKGSMQAVGVGDLLDRLLEGDDVVGGVECIGILKVDLMLTGGALVVRGFDLKAQGFQSQADLPAGVVTVVDGAQVEVAGLIAGLGGGLAVLVDLEQEELALRANVEGVAHVSRPL